jgi:hypothetical protein
MEVRVGNLIAVLQLANDDTGVNPNSFCKEQDALF